MRLDSPVDLDMLGSYSNSAFVNVDSFSQPVRSNFSESPTMDEMVDSYPTLVKKFNFTIHSCSFMNKELTFITCCYVYVYTNYKYDFKKKSPK